MHGDLSCLRLIVHCNLTMQVHSHVQNTRTNGAEGPPEGRLDDEGGGCEPPAASALQLRQLAGPQEHPRLANLQSAYAGMSEAHIALQTFCGQSPSLASTSAGSVAPPGQSLWTQICSILPQFYRALRCGRLLLNPGPLLSSKLGDKASACRHTGIRDRPAASLCRKHHLGQNMWPLAQQMHEPLHMSDTCVVCTCLARNVKCCKRADLPAVQSRRLQNFAHSLRQLPLIHAIQVQWLICSPAVCQQDCIPLRKRPAQPWSQYESVSWTMHQVESPPDCGAQGR